MPSFSIWYEGRIIEPADNESCLNFFFLFLSFCFFSPYCISHYLWHEGSFCSFLWMFLFFLRFSLYFLSVEGGIICDSALCVCVSKYVCMSFYHLYPEVQIKLLLYYQKVFFFSYLLKVFHPCKFSGFSWNKFSVFWNPGMIFKQLPKYKHFRKKRWYFMIFVYYGKPTKIFSMQVASEWVIDK